VIKRLKGEVGFSEFNLVITQFIVLVKKNSEPLWPRFFQVHILEKLLSKEMG
jgi:hypothetical protein